MSVRTIAIAAAVLAAVALTPTLTVAAKDDPAAIAAKREALKKDLKAKGFFYTFDLCYSFDVAKTKETRWDWTDPPPFNGVNLEKGGQFLAKWSSGSGAAVGITVSVQKFPHFQRNGSLQTDFNLPFKAWGKSVSCSKKDDLAEGFYQEWIATATDVIKDKCKPPKKRTLGPGEFYATAVGTDGDEKVRQRKIWVVWGTTGASAPCTWVATATLSDKYFDTEEVIAKAEALISVMKEIPENKLK